MTHPPTLRLLGEHPRAQIEAALADLRALPRASWRAAAPEAARRVAALLPCGVDEDAEACSAVDAEAWCAFRRSNKTGPAEPAVELLLEEMSCARDSEIEAARARARRLGGAGVPSRFLPALLASEPRESEAEPGKLDEAPVKSLIETDALKAVRAIRGGSGCSVELAAAGVSVRIPGSPSLIVLAGPPGSGKSFAAAWAVMLNQAGGDWARASDLVRPKSDGDGLREDPDDAAHFRGLLVVDDLALEPGGEREVGILERLLCRRHDSVRLTICTTNATSDEIRARYGGRVLDRLDAWIPCVDPSLRRRRP